VCAYRVVPERDERLLRSFLGSLHGRARIDAWAFLLDLEAHGDSAFPTTRHGDWLLSRTDSVYFSYRIEGEVITIVDVWLIDRRSETAKKTREKTKRSAKQG
jgi:hypothetical protein